MTKTFKRLVLAGHSSYPSFPEIILLSYSWLGEQTCAPYCALIPAEPSGPSPSVPSGPNPTPTYVCTSEHQSAFILAMLGPDQHVCGGKLLLFVKDCCGCHFVGDRQKEKKHLFEYDSNVMTFHDISTTLSKNRRQWTRQIHGNGAAKEIPCPMNTLSAVTTPYN